MKSFFLNTLSILSRKEKKRFFLQVLLDIAITLLDLAFLALLLFVVGYYTNSFDPGLVPENISSLITPHPLILIGSFLVLFTIKNLLAFFIFRMQFKFVYRVASRLSEKTLRRYLDGSYEDFVNIDPSIHIRRISQQTVEFSHHVLRGLQLIISNTILVMLTLLAIIAFNASLFGLLLIMLLPAVIFIAVLTRKKLAGIRQAAKTDRERSIQYLNEALGGFIESNIYQEKEFFVERYSRYQERFNTGLAEQLVMQNLPARMMEVFAVLGLFFLVVINTYITDSGSLLLLTGAFMAAAYKIIPGIVRILNNLQQLKIFAYTVDELSDIMKHKPVPKLQNKEPISSIEFFQVGFSYGGRKILENLDFRLIPGQLTGISGISGRGKTTLLNLLLGFLEASEGYISINDKKTAEERRSFWSRISYSRQQPFVIHDSIQNNITFSASPDMERLWSAVNASGLTQLLHESEKGLDTLVTAGGKNISGGQRQRLMMARTLYRDADLYVLDEPFNELDPAASKELLSHVKELGKLGKMILLVTHDPGALQYCSQIIRLDEN